MEQTFDEQKEANTIKVKVDRRYLERNLARILDGRGIAELIKTREDKDAKQKAKTRNIPKTPGTPKWYTKMDQEDPLKKTNIGHQ